MSSKKNLMWSSRLFKDGKLGMPSTFPNGKKLKFTKEQSPYSLKDYGNTSSASIPLTICSELSGKVEAENQKVLLCGFGVGLSWGAVTLNLDKITCLPIIEV